MRTAAERSARSIALATGLLTAASVTVALSGCVQSRASVYQRQLSARIAPSPAPTRDVAIAFGLNRDSSAPVALTAVAE